MALQRRAVRSCHCTRSLPFSSAFLFLSVILPASSIAQITGDPAPTISFQTSTTSSSANSIPSPTQTDSNLTPTGTSSPNRDGEKSSGFNYYFVILAIAAAAFLAFLFVMGRRKKRKQVLRAQSQRALAQDVAGFRNRSRRVDGWGWPSNPIHSRNPPRVERTEGLDERGEAPPPYVPGSKPPSIRTNDGIARVGSSRSVERRASTEVDVELGHMIRPVPPPGYHDPPNSGSGDMRVSITRPDPAITTEERLGSTRRLLGSTDRSSQS